MRPIVVLVPLFTVVNATPKCFVRVAGVKDLNKAVKIRKQVRPDGSDDLVKRVVVPQPRSKEWEDEWEDVVFNDFLNVVDNVVEKKIAPFLNPVNEVEREPFLNRVEREPVQDMYCHFGILDFIPGLTKNRFTNQYRLSAAPQEGFDYWIIHSKSDFTFTVVDDIVKALKTDGFEEQPYKKPTWSYPSGPNGGPIGPVQYQGRGLLQHKSYINYSVVDETVDMRFTVGRTEKPRGQAKAKFVTETSKRVLTVDGKPLSLYFFSKKKVLKKDKLWVTFVKDEKYDDGIIDSYQLYVKVTVDRGALKEAMSKRQTNRKMWEDLLKTFFDTSLKVANYIAEHKRHSNCGKDFN